MPVTQMISLDVQLRVAQLQQLRHGIDAYFVAYITEAHTRNDVFSAVEAVRTVMLSRVDAWIQQELSS